MFKWLTALIFLIVLTGFVVIMNPGMHKSLDFFSSDISFSNHTSLQNIDAKIQHKDAVSKANTPNVQNINTFNTQKVLKQTHEQEKAETQHPPDTKDYLQKIKEREALKYAQLEKQKAQIKAQEQKQTDTPAKAVLTTSKTTNTQAPSAEKSSKPHSQSADPKPVNKTQSAPNPKPAAKQLSANSSNKTQSAPQTKTTAKTTAPLKKNNTSQKLLTQQEETIAWNKWRSDVDNKIHICSESDMPSGIPFGTRYKYSFTVDKKRNITNIKVQILSYPVNDAVKKGMSVIKSTISSLEKDPVLEFPQGTQRMIVDVSTTVRMGTDNKYSTPADYSDYEKVIKYDYK